MRIVNFEEFLKLPAGTIFQKFEPSVCDVIAVKSDSLEWGEVKDFCLDLFGGESISDHLSSDVSVTINTGFTIRDASYNPKQLFAVWEEEDILVGISVFTKALNLFKEQT